MSDLREALERLGLSQAAFARLTGKGTVTVNRWCRGLQAVDPIAWTWLSMYEALTPEQRLEIWPSP